jgi:hypothetical protein
LKIALLVFAWIGERGEPPFRRGLVTMRDGDEVDVEIAWGDCA